MHRIAYTAFIHAPAEGAELAYTCGETACVNPGHAQELPLPERDSLDVRHRGKGHVSPRPSQTPHQHSRERIPARFVDHAFLDRYGFADASSLAERVVFFTPAG